MVSGVKTLEGESNFCTRIWEKITSRKDQRESSGGPLECFTCCKRNKCQMRLTTDVHVLVFHHSLFAFKSGMIPSFEKGEEFSPNEC